LAAVPGTGVRISGGNITAFAAGAIAAGNTVVVNGSGSLTLFGDNTLAGLKFNNLGGTPIVRTFATNSATGLGSRGVLTIGAGGIVATSENTATASIIEGRVDFGSSPNTIDVAAINVNGVTDVDPLRAGFVLQAVVGSTGGLTKTGNGVLQFSAQSQFTGGLTIAAGGLRNNGTNAGSRLSRLTLAAGTRYDLYNANTTWGSLAGSGDIFSSIASPNLQVGFDGTSSTFSGRFQRFNNAFNTTLTKIGSGVLTLDFAQDGDGSYGQIIVGGGTLKYSGAGKAFVGTSLQTSSFVANTNGILQLDNSGTNVANRLGLNAAGNLYIQGGKFVLGGNATAATTEALANLNIQNGGGRIELTADAAQALTLAVTTLNTGNGHGALVIGGITGAASAAGVANLTFTTINLIGGQGTGANGTTTMGIRHDILADASVSGLGTGFLVKDSVTSNYRALASTELNTAVATWASTQNAGLSSSQVIKASTVANTLTISGTATLASGLDTVAFGKFGPNGGLLTQSQSGAAASLVLAGATGNINVGAFQSATVGTTPFIHVVAGGTLNVNAAFAVGGTAGMLKADGGVLNLNGQAYFTGTATIDGGTLSLNSGVANTLLVTANAGASGAGLTNLTINGSSAVVDLKDNAQAVAALFSTNPLPGGGGTVTNSGSSVVVFTDSTQAAGVTFGGQITGNLAFTKSGANTQLLTGASTYVGETIVRGGMLQLRDSGAIASTAGLKLFYGTLNWDNYGLNSAASATPTRIAAANAVTLQGGTFTINGGGASDTVVTLDSVAAQGGANTINTLPYISMGSTITLTLGNLAVAPGSHASVNFNGYSQNNSNGNNTLGGQGLTTNSNIFLTRLNGALFSASNLINNLIGGWAVADGSAFATYSNTFGVVAMGNAYGSFSAPAFTGTDISAAMVATGNYNDGTAARSIPAGANAANSWRFGPGAAQTITFPTTSTATLGVGIITNAGFSTTLAATDATNSLASAGNDLYIFVNQNTLAIQPKIIGTAALVVNGPATLSLRPTFASNTYTGGTFVNAGTLNLQAAATFFAIPGDLTINNAAVNMSTTPNQIAPTANVFINGGGSFTLPNYATAATQSLVSLTFTNDGGTGNPLFAFGTPTAASTIILTSATPITASNDSYSTTPLLTGAAAPTLSVLQFSNASPTVTVNSGLAATGLIISALIADNAGMTGPIIKAGAGTLALTSAESTFTKGINLTAGSLMIGAASTGTAPIVTKGPLGTGTLTVSGGTTLLADGTARSVANALSVGGDFAFGGLVAGHSLTFTGATDLGIAGRTITVTNPLVTATLGGAITTTATGTALTKAGAGVLVLSSSTNNFNSAAVSITGGILKYGVTAAIPTTSAIIVGVGAGLDLNGFDFNPQTQSLTGGGFVTNSAASTSTLLVAGTSATDVTTTGDVTFGVALGDNNALNAASRLALTKGGLGTLTFTNTNSVNAGPILVVAGTVNGSATNTFSPNAIVQLGNAATATAATPTATLDVLSFDQTIGGIATGTNTAGSSAIVRIGAGRTLTTTGTNTLGANIAANDISKVFFTDGGALVANGALFQVGGATGAVNYATLTVDMTALGSFTVNAGAAGIFRVGESTSGTNGGAATIILSPANIINANVIGLGDTINGTVVQTLKLGAGTNVLNANTITLGAAPVGGNRASGVVVFNGITGSVKVRSLTDSVNGRANLNMAFNGGGSGASITANFNVTGHSADLRFDVMQLAQRMGVAAGEATATFAFDTGTLDANDLLLGYKSTTGNNSTATMTLGGTGVSVFNSATAAMRIGVNAGTSAVATGTLNISGGTVTVAGNAGTAIKLGDATAALGTAAGSINLTGGTLTTTGDIIRGATTGTSTAVLTLDGGTLDLSGNDLGGNGSATGNLTTLILASGTLKNVGQINNGAGLTKTGTNTLTLAGASSYTGVTTVSAGKLAVTSFGDGITASALGLAGLAPANLVLATGTTLGYIGVGETSARGFTVNDGATLDASGAGAIAISSAAKVAFANSTATRSLTLDGTSTGANSFGAGLSVGGTLDADKINLIVKNGVGTWIIANGETLKSNAEIDVNVGILGLAAGVLSATGRVVLANGSTLRFESGNTDDLSDRVHFANGASATVNFVSDVTFASALTVDGASPATLVKSGAGKLTLAAANTSVAVTVAQGTVNVTNASGLGTAATTVNGGLLAVNTSIANIVNVNAGGTVGGGGSIATLNVVSGATLSPGNSPGTLTAGNVALFGGSIFEWQVQDANNVAKYDHFNVTGTLDLSSASSANRIVFKVVSLLGAGDGLTTGRPLNFAAAFGPEPAAQRIKTFSLGTVANINLGANANINDVFSFDLSQFTYSDGTASGAGVWSIAWDSGNQLITVTAVPEPSTYGFGLGALALAAAAIRRRKRQATKA
jgi:autotransporter-associated beta strand protein